MRKLILALSFMALGMGTTNAANPQWVAAVPASVQLAPNFTGATIPYAEGTPVFYVSINGVLHVSNYDSEKTKAWYTMALNAYLNGKRLWIYADADKIHGVNSCLNYDIVGCYHKNPTNYYPIIQEMAVRP